MDSSIQNRRLKANDFARRASDDFFETYGQSPLDLIAPFEREEVIIGRRVGTGSFSRVYEIKSFSLRPDQSDVYTEEQIEKREATVRSMTYGAKYVLKCLKDDLEDSEDVNEFTEAAEDIAHEAEMLAALSHPNIVKLHGVTADRRKAFLDGASSFFVILERLESTLSDTIEVWKEKNSSNLSNSIRSLGSSLHSISSFSSSGALDKQETTEEEAGSLETRLGIAASLAGAVEYLHSQGVIFHDLKPDNVGFDMLGNVKLFDFGLARFMPRYGNPYKDVYEMSGAGTPRFTAPEVFFEKPYNLKADVYSFGVVLWGIMSLKKPFGKCKYRDDFEKALLRVDKVLAINRKWPRSIQDIIRLSLLEVPAQRPTMSEVCNVINCFILELEDGTFESAATTNLTRSTSFALPSRLSSSRLSSKGALRRRLSFTSAVPSTSILNDDKLKRRLSDTSATTSTIGTLKTFCYCKRVLKRIRNREIVFTAYDTKVNSPARKKV